MSWSLKLQLAVLFEASAPSVSGVRAWRFRVPHTLSRGPGTSHFSAGMQVGDRLCMESLRCGERYDRMNGYFYDG